MARTDVGAELTEQHRQAQLQVRGQALRDFGVLWPIWRVGDDSSFTQLAAATLPLVRVYNRISASVATSYYRALRSAEQVDGQPTPRPGLVPPDGRITTSLYVTGKNATRNAVRAGQSPQGARETTLVRVSGAVTRHVLQGGREALLDSVAADEQAVGWARVTDGDPCAFCLTLASRGAVYKTEKAASFEAHDHCGCTVMPMYSDSDLPPLTERWREIYETAQREGFPEPGPRSSNERINAVRQHLAHV